MNLIESCRHFERYHRNSDRKPMTFAAYNAKYGTTLPEGRKDVEQNYHKHFGCPQGAWNSRSCSHDFASSDVGFERATRAKRAVKPRLMKNKDGLVGTVYTGALRSPGMDREDARV